MSNSILLKTEESLENEAKRFRKLLTRVSQYEFWEVHFSNHNFRFQPEKFSWEYWYTIPFFTKEDFLRIGLAARLKDAGIGNRTDPYGFMLRVTSGTSGFAEPPLLLRSIGVVIKEDELRTLWVYGSFVISLQGALIHVLANCKEGIVRHQALVLTHRELRPEALEGIRDFHADNISGFPNDLTNFAAAFSGASSSLPPIKKISVGGDFLGKSQLALIQSVFGATDVTLEYGLSEFGKVGHPCEFLKERYGFNAYHPNSKKYIIELADIDEEGYGEIIGTNLSRPELALLRYRTGDVGKAIEEKCPCGEEFTLFLLGRKNFDYVKCAGAMIVRPELERVMEKFKEYVEEWRAEAREFTRFNSVIGELTLKIKPTPSLDSHQNLLPSIAGRISQMLYLTPSATLMDIVQKQLFLPLKLEIVDKFPDAPKRVLIRKIVD